MGKIKMNTRSIIKTHDGEKYFFKNGFAKVPGCMFGGKPMKVSLKEFNQLITEAWNGRQGDSCQRTNHRGESSRCNVNGVDPDIRLSIIYYGMGQSTTN